MTSRPTQNSPIDRLRKVLALEAEKGFANTAVTGGLERFLENLRPQIKDHPAYGTLDGLLTVAYHDLSVEQRKRWARAIEPYISDSPAPKPRRAPTSKPAPAEPVEQPAPNISPDSPTTALKGVTRPVAHELARMGLRNIGDLIEHYPNRHIDYRGLRPIAQTILGEEQTVVVTLWNAHRGQLLRHGRGETIADVGDDSGNMRVVWFNQPWVAADLQKSLSKVSGLGRDQAKVILSGKVELYGRQRKMNNPRWEVVDDPETADLMNAGRLVPVYPATMKIKEVTVRRIVRDALESQRVDGELVLDETLPEELIRRNRLMPRGKAVWQVHYPESQEAYEEARRRIAFDEFLHLQLAIEAKRPQRAETRGIALTPMPDAVRLFIDSLPFKLTNGQDQAIADAMNDVAKAEHPMSRLLQGDVGSGKTVIAMAMLLTAVADGYQGALMAPTEVLAEQHFLGLRRMLASLIQPSLEADSFTLRLGQQEVTLGLLTGSTKAAARRDLIRRASEGTIDILVGTHALIQEDVELSRLALAVVDEQHRFGVLQRAALRKNTTAPPHLLMMSATPIPRTLALTLYSDLDVSNMPELPRGRKQIDTRIVEPSKVPAAEEFIVKQAGEGRQAFVVCPLIDESESVLARAATAEFDRLRDTSMSSLKLGLLHGRMPLAEKQSVMDRFRQGELDVLVTTPVIEVGIDVPNATVMLIEGADRFGLAQLHQLRGRVGRGEHQSYCLLTSDALSEDARKRLDVLVKTNDGFQIAEADLEFRGAGDVFGTRQSGLSPLKLAKLSDRDLLAKAKEEARALVESNPSLTGNERLAAAVKRYIKRVVPEDA